MKTLHASSEHCKQDKGQTSTQNACGSSSFVLARTITNGKRMFAFALVFGNVIHTETNDAQNNTNVPSHFKTVTSCSGMFVSGLIRKKDGRH